MDVDGGEAREEDRSEEVHVPGADDELGAVLAEPVGHRRVALLARGVVGKLERPGGHSGRSRALERGRLRDVRRDGDDRQVGVEERLQVRAASRDEDADHASSVHTTPPGPFLDLPDERVPGVRGVGARNDRAVADPEVEHPPLLLLGHVARGEPVEDGRPLPRTRVDARAQTSGKRAAEIAGDASAGDVSEGAHVHFLFQLAHLVQVQTVGREHEVGVEGLVPDDRAHEREAVRVQAGRRQADHDVSGAAAGAVDQLRAPHETDARSREVELALAVDARQLGGLAADERAAGRPADGREPLHEVGNLLELEDARGDVVEEEERIGAGRDDVVHAVRAEVGADVSQSPGAAREAELVADAVGRGGE